MNIKAINGRKNKMGEEEISQMKENKTRIKNNWMNE